MKLAQKKTPSYLIKHRQRWQVKLTIPRDVRWAFDNKTTFKRSTGCNIVDTHNAIIERDRIVAKFKKSVDLHRSGMMKAEKDKNLFEGKFNNRPYPQEYYDTKSTERPTERGRKSDVDGWIKERLLKKGKKTKVLRYDFWAVEGKKI